MLFALNELLQNCKVALEYRTHPRSDHEQSQASDPAHRWRQGLFPIHASTSILNRNASHKAVSLDPSLMLDLEHIRRSPPDDPDRICGFDPRYLDSRLCGHAEPFAVCAGNVEVRRFQH